MANANPNRIGQNLAAGDPLALFKLMYATEVLAKYHTAVQTDGHFMERTIVGSKGADFPVTGIAGGGYHTVGAEIAGRIVKASHKTIMADDLVYSDVFVPKIDELKQYWDVRSAYVKEQGAFMAKLNDIYKLVMALKAARSPANVPGETPSGTRLVDAAMKTDPSKLAAALYAASVQFDENGIPQEGRNAWLPPSLIALMVQNKDAINKDYNGSGSYAEGSLWGIAGIPIIKTTHIPRTDLLTAGTLDANVKAIFGGQTDASLFPAKYQIDASSTAGLVTHEGAIGTVKLADMTVDIDRDPRRLGTLIVTSQVQGTDVLRPECAIELAAS